jgi:hypothetical protein
MPRNPQPELLIFRKLFENPVAGDRKRALVTAKTVSAEEKSLLRWKK